MLPAFDDQPPSKCKLLSCVGSICSIWIGGYSIELQSSCVRRVMVKWAKEGPLAVRLIIQRPTSGYLSSLYEGYALPGFLPILDLPLIAHLRDGHAFM